MKSISILAAVLCLASCSIMQIERVTEKSYKDGLRFYRPEPYLVVTVTPEKGLNNTIIWLPNYNEGYVLRPKGGFGSSEISATLENGWNLTDLGLVRDSKVPETISSITGAVSTAAEVFKFDAAAKEKILVPGLYRIIFTNGIVSGLERINLQEPD
jgi:hypothetical protein